MYSSLSSSTVRASPQCCHCSLKETSTSGVARIWRWVAQGVWGTEVPQRGPGAEPLVGGSGGIASRKLIAVNKDIWLPNHAQFCVFSSTAQPGIFLWSVNPISGGTCPFPWLRQWRPPVIPVLNVKNSPTVAYRFQKIKLDLRAKILWPIGWWAHIWMLSQFTKVWKNEKICFYVIPNSLNWTIKL